MAKGKTAEACAQFELSLRHEATKGTLYNLGLCHEKLGKLASAYVELREVSATDSNTARADDARQRAHALERRLTRMRLRGPLPPGAVIKRDGVDVTAFVEQATPVDPDTYTFELSVPGRAPQKREVELRGEGELVDVSIAELAAGPAYPMALPHRPLVLPRGMYELGSELGLIASDNEAPDPIFLRLLGRFSFGPVEVGLGATVLLRQEEIVMKPNPLLDVTIGAYYAITPMFPVGIEYTNVRPFGTYGAHGFDVRVLGAHKWNVHSHVALVGGGGVRYSQRQAIGSGTDAETTLQSDGRAQFKVVPRLSAEAIAKFGLHLGGGLYSQATQLDVGVNVVVVVRDDMDVYAQAFAELLPSAAHRTFVIGVSYRNNAY